MELKNMLLWAALAFILLLIYQQWEADYGSQSPTQVSQTQSTSAAQNQGIPEPAKDAPAAPETRGDTPAQIVEDSLQSRQRVHIHTDVLDIEIDTVGGDIRQALLPQYPVSVDKPDVPFRLMGEGEDTFIAQSGLVAPAKSNIQAPDHHAIYKTEKTEYELGEGEDALEVVLSWTGDSGVKVDKVYRFERGSYQVDVRYEVTNTGTQPWQAYMYRQLQRSEVEMQTGLGMLPVYTGAVYSGFNKLQDEAVSYEKYDFGDMEDRNLDTTLQGGWAAMIQHYFLVAMIPEQDETNRFYSLKADGDRYAIGMIETQQHKLNAGESTQFGYEMFIGPKVQDLLKEVAPNLHLTVDYGFTTIIADPLFWLLDWIHGWVGNWGWAIIIMTILIKAVFYRLQAKSFHSMAKMRKLNPRIQQLKERYGDNKQGFQQAMMELWKKEKVNPFGGCLPILIQMPIFIAFYWVLLESVELRQADWILWYKDLSLKDPYFVLPILNGISMYIQFKLNPAPTDPIQEKIMMFMPIFVSVLFLFFPAGLVLYWTVNGILQNIQQYFITKEVEKAGH
ncbi:MAG: membrane protein insertase YidC [Gammaproteobacteria bacterium]|nr:membrane protein insertase YidC [Gammaproteobacteria bacterium]